MNSNISNKQYLQWPEHGGIRGAFRGSDPSSRAGGEVEVVGPVHGVCVAVLSVCVACPVCLPNSFLPTPRIAAHWRHSISLSISPSRSLDRLLGRSHLSISPPLFARPSRHSSISWKKEDEKQTSGRERAVNCGMQERSHSFLHSFLPSLLEWRGWLPPPEARVRDQGLPNEDLVARRGGRPSLPGRGHVQMTSA